jgi:pimeloyl-ACP methyl ester carboxylesterase
MNARLSRLTAGVVILLLALGAGKAEAEFRLTGQAKTFANAPGVVEWRYKSIRGSSPFDRIALHRTTARKLTRQGDSVVLYLPGTNMNGEVPFDDPNHSLTLYLANHGIDAWALDYRTHFVPPDTSGDGLAQLKDWTDELFESDIDEAVRFILDKTHREKIFIAGFSHGVSLAYLYAAAHPSHVHGLIVLDGFVLDSGLAARRRPRPEAANPYADDLGGAHLTFDKRRALLELVIRDPDAAAPIPKYKTARENLEHVVADSAAFGGHGGLANPQGGYSDAVVLAKEMITFDRWWPSVQDGETSLTPDLKESLKNSGIPVIAFTSTNIAPQWPEMVATSARLTGTPDVTIITLAHEGHLDVLVGTRDVADVFEPIVQWIKRHPK